MKNNFSPFDYELPREKIAERPVHPYDSAKLLLLDKKSGVISTSCFIRLPEIINQNHIFVFNNTRVNKSRLFGKLKSGKKTEVLLLKNRQGNLWEAIAKPVKSLKPGTLIEFGEELNGAVIERLSEQIILIEFVTPDNNLQGLLNKYALMPIPPYIRNGFADSQDEKDYQTIFAKNTGSVAAPTASLHFTENLVSKIKLKGAGIEYLTLHLGMSSVRPVWDGEFSGDLREPGEEYYLHQKDLLRKLISYKESGKKIIAVGTSVVRALESLFLDYEKPETDNSLQPTKLFIRPGFKFNLIDALVTNFHFPASTHLLLVQALIGENLLKLSYDYALNNNYRFLSYGDGMLIL